MSLLVDVFGYLVILIHGLTIVSQSMTLGGIFFLIFLLRPVAPLLGEAGDTIQRRVTRMTIAAAFGLMVSELLAFSLNAAVLNSTVDISVVDILTATFAVAGAVKIVAALVLAMLLLARGAMAPRWLMLVVIAVELAAAVFTTHAAARLQDRNLLLVTEFLHHLGAAIWIGGIPSFCVALWQLHDGAVWRAVGARFSRMCMIGVACILASGLIMSFFYIGSWQGLYGTAYGVMVGTKICLFIALILLGFGNFRLIERLRRNPQTPINRLKRFAEVEIGLGFSLFFAAASLTSSPPAIDLTQDRVTFHEILERNRPVWPRLASPDHDTLALPALQAKLDAEAAAAKAKPSPAFVPGSGDLPERNAADIAWSEFNHHWAGVFMLAIGILALLNQAGLRMARHWPLIFLGMAGFLFLRSDPEVWPLGEIGFFDSLRDVEVLQHRFFVLLIIVFGLFEWRVRAFDWSHRRAALVFPLACAVGGAALLTHSHAIANIKDQLLIELTHTPLALLGMAAGWARWLELRLDPPGNRIAGWVWPCCFVLVGLVLLSYREA
ncbi:MAG TPA: CopD family protein [Dongiaceae bacterium]|nr:CopD family protein [Dongiaceae bacterium]